MPGDEVDASMPELWRFAKIDPEGAVVLVTSYFSDGEHADQILRDLRKMDLMAIKDCGFRWEKVPAATKPVSVGVPSDEEYIRRMAEVGIGRERALELRRMVESA